MKNASLMAIGEAAKQLKQKQSNVSMVEATRMTLHILGEVGVLKIINYPQLASQLQPAAVVQLTTYSNTKVRVSLVWTMS